MEVSNFKALDELIINYKYVGLFNIEGAQLIAFNNAQTPKEKKVTAIKKRLTSPALPDGIYIIKCKDTTKGETADEIHFIKGNAKPSDEPTPPGRKTLNDCGAGPNVLTYAEAVRLNTEIQKLTYEVQLKDKEIADLTSDLDDAENELQTLKAEQTEKLSEPPKNTLSEIGTTLKDLLPSITAVFDTHYSLRDREIKLKEKQFIQPPPPVQAPPGQMPENTFILDDNEQQILMYFEALKEQHPDKYNLFYDNMIAEINGGGASNEGGQQ